jgi:hypothetical protein
MTLTESRARTAPPEASTIASGQLRALYAGHRVMGGLAVMVPPLLAGYILFDKGFAYIHIPGTPIFAGEFLVLAGMAAAIAATGYIHLGVRHSAVAKLLLVFAVWGLARTVPNLEKNGLDAVRDSALWYYSLLAIPICALVLWNPDLLRRWTRSYRRLIPWFLVWSPLAYFLAKESSKGLPPLVPDSTLSFWAHQPGNIAVHVTIALAFLWLVPGAGGRLRPALTALATVILLIGATQNRGGLVAALAGLGLLWMFAKRRGRMTLAMISTVLLIIVIGWGANVQIRGEQNRRISVEQLVQNVGSLTGKDDSQAPGNLNSNVEFRDQLWSAVIHKVRTEKRVLTGLGFGPNIAREVGFQGQATTQLRSPHNSHIDVFARMGAIGLAIWIALWGVWYTIALRARSRLRTLGRAFERGLVEVAVVGATAILINAYFDPTLESPQVAIWLWTLVGITLGCAAIGRRATAPQPASQRPDNALPQLPG